MTTDDSKSAPPAWLDAPTTVVIMVPEGLYAVDEPKGGPDAVAKEIATQAWGETGWRLVNVDDPGFVHAVDRTFAEMIRDGMRCELVDREKGVLVVVANLQAGTPQRLTRHVRVVLLEERAKES